MVEIGGNKYYTLILLSKPFVFRNINILTFSFTTTIGKSSLKKTMFGEPYDPREKPSSGILADQSVTRITFKQYREWVQQPASKADTLRLNLEYIDSIIDYVLKFLRQPRVCVCVCVVVGVGVFVFVFVRVCLFLARDSFHNLYFLFSWWILPLSTCLI